MNHHSKRTRSTPPIAWIFLSGLAGIALYESIKDPPLSPTLEFANQDRPVVVRVSEPSFHFPVLAVRIALPDDWIYLSKTNTELAEQPTFLNARSKAIVRLRPGWNIQWNGQNVEVVHQEFNDLKIEWLKPAGTITSTLAQQEDREIKVRWRVYQAVRVGRLTKGEIDLIVETISYDLDGENEILAFFDSIEPGIDG